MDYVSAARTKISNVGKREMHASCVAPFSRLGSTPRYGYHLRRPRISDRIDSSNGRCSNGKQWILARISMQADVMTAILIPFSMAFVRTIAKPRSNFWGLQHIFRTSISVKWRP